MKAHGARRYGQVLIGVKDASVYVGGRSDDGSYEMSGGR